jgi:hypothetical protein
MTRIMEKSGDRHAPQRLKAGCGRELFGRAEAVALPGQIQDRVQNRSSENACTHLGAAGVIGVLRLHSSCASRATNFAQDDRTSYCRSATSRKRR